MATSIILSGLVERLYFYVLLEAGVRREVKKLITTLQVLRPVLNDAEKKRFNDYAVKLWLEKVKGVLYDAEDVLDDAEDVLDVASGSIKVLSSCFTSCYCFKRVHVPYSNISHIIKEIRRNLDELWQKGVELGLVFSAPPQLTTSFIGDTSGILGRDGDVETIITMLLDEMIHVISVVGMGGMGKTTLAKLVCKDKAVVETFQIIWVCVSQAFDLRRIAEEIIHQVTARVHTSGSMPDLLQELSNSFKSRRFLLVLDDVWTKDQAHWEPLKLSLIDGASSGSRIIITTRNSEVAKMMDSTHIHMLKGLSGQETCFLIGRIVLRGRESEMKIFEELQKKIIGVPLTIQMFAKLLSMKRTIKDWRAVADINLCELPGFEDEVLRSFYPLSSISKECFLYCTMFPKGTKMYKDDLVKLWMAQGFFKTDGVSELENIGESFFDILAKYSFFHGFEEDSDGNITSCQIHDLLHDLAQSLAGRKYCSMEVINQEFNATTVRHLRMAGLENPSVYQTKNLRTLMKQGMGTSIIPVQLFNRLPCLRTLDLSESDLQELPNEVGQLLLLRYLDLSYTRITELPESICNLYNLQTLKLNMCGSLCRLPDKIGDLRNLRHLDIQQTMALSYLPHGIKGLIFLRTLSKFIVGGPNGRSMIEDLGDLINLTGTLEIIGLEQVINANDAAKARLKEKRGIRAYKFNFELFEEDEARKLMEDVLDYLEPNEDLERLCIKRYPGYQFPGWMHDSVLLSSIVDMELLMCENSTELPALGKLPLKRLKLYGMSSVKHIGDDFYGYDSGRNASAQMIAFPRLEKLEFRSMDNWGKWELPIPNNAKVMPYLSQLTLHDCPKLEGLPCLGSWESLEVLEVSKLPSVQHLDLVFHGISADIIDKVVFPKLKKLVFREMMFWEEWVLPVSEGTKVMPCLTQLELKECPKLRALPCLGKLESLEILKIWGLSSVNCVGPRFLWPDVAADYECSSGKDVVVFFPKLKVLDLHNLPELKQWNIPSVRGYTPVIMPHLRDLTISQCPLRTLPDFAKFSPMLKKLEIKDCPGLGREQPCLPPLLQELTLYGDVGIFSEALPINNISCSITSLTICRHSSLPKGFNELKELQTLSLYNCESLDFELMELRQLTMLRCLYIGECPTLKERFRGEQWRDILSHVPNIYIDFKHITSRN